MSPVSPEQRVVLVVDDDAAVALVLERMLHRDGYAVRVVGSAEQALTAVRSQHVDVVLSDIRMPGMDGMSLLRRLKEELPDVPVVLMTAHGSVPLAVEAMKAGACDFLLKPFERDEVLRVLEKAIAELGFAVSESPRAAAFSSVSSALHNVPATRDLANEITRFGAAADTILVLGESGTGKELVARALHDQQRGGGAFVALNCAAVPESLIESELFGFEKGAFTGAASRRLGKFELADGGTLMLDEIGDASPALQAKLLRVLETRSFERLGGAYTVHVMVRVVACTHRDLASMVARGEFRQDLYYRLSAFTCSTTPLRSRPQDISLLSIQFAAEFSERHRRRCILSHSALRALQQHPWPGNVRELRSLIERLVILSDHETANADDVARELGVAGAPKTHDRSEHIQVSDVLSEHRSTAERAALVNALARAGGNKALAARVLQISRRTLYNKMADLGIETE